MEEISDLLNQYQPVGTNRMQKQLYMKITGAIIGKKNLIKLMNVVVWKLPLCPSRENNSSVFLTR